MLFNSYPFLLAFLPGAVAVFAIINRYQRLRIPCLVALSLLFYGYWNLSFVLLLVASILAFELRVRSLRHKEQELKRRVEEEMASVRVLRGLLPICSWCKKVRDDAGYWKQIALSPHPDLLFVP